MSTPVKCLEYKSILDAPNDDIILLNDDSRILDSPEKVEETVTFNTDVQQILPLTMRKAAQFPERPDRP